MVNMNNIMKQAQIMQKKMLDMQDSLAKMEFTGDAGAGAVKLTINGKYEVLKLTIHKNIVDPQEIAMLEDLVTAAFNDAKSKLEEYSQGGISSMLSGIQLPTGL